MYLDETAFNRSIFSSYGYSLKGTSLFSYKHNLKPHFINVIATLSNDLGLRFLIREKTSDAKVIQRIFKEMDALFHPKKKYVIILDNAAVHVKAGKDT